MSTTISEGQTVSSSNYYHKCAGCVERDQRISTLVATLDDLRERTAAREGELLGTIDALQAKLEELRRDPFTVSVCQGCVERDQRIVEKDARIAALEAVIKRVWVLQQILEGP